MVMAVIPTMAGKAKILTAVVGITMVVRPTVIPEAITAILVMGEAPVTEVAPVMEVIPGLKVTPGMKEEWITGETKVLQTREEEWMRTTLMAREEDRTTTTAASQTRGENS